MMPEREWSQQRTWSIEKEDLGRGGVAETLIQKLTFIVIEVYGCLKDKRKDIGFFLFGFILKWIGRLFLIVDLSRSGQVCVCVPVGMTGLGIDIDHVSAHTWPNKQTKYKQKPNYTSTITYKPQKYLYGTPHTVGSTAPSENSTAFHCWGYQGIHRYAHI